MKKRDETGSTALEALIAIAVISIAGIALVAGSRNGLAAIAKAESAATDSSKILRIDDALRAAASEVRIPYWARGVELTTDGRTVSVPWYGGHAAEKLQISIAERSIVLKAGDATRNLSGVADARLAVARNTEGAVAGIELVFKMRDSEVRVLAPFGSAAIMNGERE